jgi:acetyl esterase
VADHASEIGGDPSRIAVGGDGAGGNLAAVVSLMARERRGPDLVYQVLIYPILDALMTSYSWVESDDPILTRDSMVARWSVYVPVNVDQENPYISPATAKNFAKLPPTLIITGMRDPVSDTARQYASELKREGIPTQLVRYEHVIHCFFLMAAALDDGKKSIEETADALKRRFADLEPE